MPATGLLVAAFLAVAACTRPVAPTSAAAATPEQPRGGRGGVVNDAAVRVQQQQPASRPPPAAGWRGLVPGMSTQAARRVLGGLGVAVGGNFGAGARPPHWLSFECDGWRGTAYLGHGDREVTAILLTGAPMTDTAAARRAFERASAGRGSPAASRRVVGTDGTFVEESRTWRDSGAVLTVELHEWIHGTEHGFVVTEQWSRQRSRP